MVNQPRQPAFKWCATGRTPIAPSAGRRDATQAGLSRGGAMSVAAECEVCETTWPFALIDCPYCGRYGPGGPDRVRPPRRVASDAHCADNHCARRTAARIEDSTGCVAQRPKAFQADVGDSAVTTREWNGTFDTRQFRATILGAKAGAILAFSATVATE